MSAWLARRIERHAAEQGARPALITASRSWTWRALDETARRGAAALAAAGVVPGSIAVVAMSRGPEVAFAVCSAHRAGAVPAVVDPGDPDQVASICERLRPAAVVVQSSPAGASRVAGTVAFDGAGVVALPRRALAWKARRAVLGVSHLIHTSGTTQEGKCIAWSEARAEADAALRAPVGVQGDRGRPGIIVPLCVSLGFHEMLRALARGCAFALVDHPLPMALRVLDELAVTGFQCTPTHVDLLLRSAAPVPRTLRRINVSSAPISGERLRELAARIAPASVTKSYGLTEVGPVAVLRAHELAHGDTVGRPLDDREVAIVDARGRRLPPGRTGEIVVRVAAWARDGYFLARAGLAQRFTGGVLRTGDRGHLDAAGFLVLEERAAELIKVGGRTVSAPRIEQRLGELAVFAELAVVGVPHRRLGEVPAVAFTPSPRTPDLAALERLVARRLPADDRPRWFLALGRLPRTASGKLRRGAIAARLRRWVEAWPGSVTCGARVLPARGLPSPPGWPRDSGRIFAADGGPARWPRWAGPRPRDALARVISVVDGSGATLLALAWIRDAGHSAHAVARRWIAPSFRGSRIADVVDAMLEDAVRGLRSASDR